MKTDTTLDKKAKDKLNKKFVGRVLADIGKEQPFPPPYMTRWYLKDGKIVREHLTREQVECQRNQ